MEWIKIKDRLSEPYKLVLISNGDYITIGQYRPLWNNGNGAFASEAGCGLDSQPTHWMDLPKLPRIDSEN